VTSDYSEYVDSEDSVLCGQCGRRQSRDSNYEAPGWLYVEIDRDVGMPIYKEFCGQEHAADWLQKPLPEPKPLSVPDRTPKERLFLGVRVVLLLYGIAAAVIGTWTLVHWVTPDS
jgi:hypothetical protein